MTRVDLGMFDGDPTLTAEAERAHTRRLADKWAAERASRPLFCPARRCTAILAWVLTETGEWMPVNREPTQKGTVAAEDIGGGVLVARAPGETQDGPPGARYVSHAETCSGGAVPGRRR